MNQTIRKTIDSLRIYGLRSVMNNRSISLPISINLEQKRHITKGRVNVLIEMKRREKDFDAEPHKLRHRREWLDWNYDCELYAFNNRLKEKFDPITLKQVFIDQSYQNKTTQIGENDAEIFDQIQLENNVEFVQSGREICNHFIPKYLRYFLRTIPEEGIEAIKNFLMNNESLADMATQMGCEELVLCEDFPVTKPTLASTMLSLIGALRRDTDDEHTNRFIIDFVMTYLYSKDIMDVWQINDPERMVRLILKTNDIDDFEYRLLRQTGINTLLPSYLIGVYCNQKLLAFGPGSTIEEGKEMASLDCLRRIFNLNNANQVYKFGEKAYNLDYKQFETVNQSVDNFKSEHLARYR